MFEGEKGSEIESAKQSEVQSPPRGSSGARKLLYGCLFLFLLVATIALGVGAFSVVTAVRGVESVTNPVGNLFRELILEATPVIVPNPVVVVQEINSLARLETSSYSFQDIIQIERNNDLLWGAFGESLLFVAFGDVIAGVDLAKMQPEDLQVVSPTEVIVHLPEAEIFFARLDNDRSYVANRDMGLFTKGDTELETVVRREAEDRMHEAALANGILDRADEEAQTFIRSFLQELGFETVTFVENTPPVITPQVPEVPKGYVVTPVPTPLGPDG